METKDTSKKILDASLRVFSKSGYHDAHIDDVAKLAGVAKGTVYLYYSGKKELFISLLKDVATNHLEKVTLIRKNEEELDKKLLMVVSEHFKLFEAKKDMLQSNFHEIIHSDKEMKKTVFSFRDKYRDLIGSLIADSMSKKSPNDNYIKDVSTAFLGLMFAFEMELMHRKKDFKIEELSERIVDIFMNGIKGNIS